MIRYAVKHSNATSSWRCWYGMISYALTHGNWWVALVVVYGMIRCAVKYSDVVLVLS